MLRLSTCTHCEQYKEHWLHFPLTSIHSSLPSLDNIGAHHLRSLQATFHGSTRSTVSRNISPKNITASDNLRLTIKIDQKPFQPFYQHSPAVKLALNLRTPNQSPTERSPKDPIIKQQKKQKDGSKVEEAKKDSMPSKSGYYEASRSSSGSEAERIHHNPRREHRDRGNNQSCNRRTVVVIHHDRPTGDAGRKAEQEGGRWK